jgi:hypothetical protein
MGARPDAPSIEAIVSQTFTISLIFKGSEAGNQVIFRSFTQSGLNRRKSAGLIFLTDFCGSKYNLKEGYQFRVLKKWCDRLCWGPGSRTERAGSIGWVAPWLRRSKLVFSGGGGGHLPRPLHEEISSL